MRNLIIFSFLTLLLTPMALAQDRSEAPVWNVGDKWTYKDSTGTTYTNEVLDVKEDVFVLKYQGLQNPAGFDKRTMNIKFLIGTGGNKILDTESLIFLKKLFDFPIFVGKQWTDSYDLTLRAPGGRPVPLPQTLAYKIENLAEVSTTAGTFKTYIIYLNQRSTRTGNNGWIRHWYSPEAKTWIKREIEKTNFWAPLKMYDSELISYELKK